MSERWRQLSERQIAESLLAQGRTVEEIQAAIRLKRQTLKAEAERDAKIAEALKKQEEAEKAAFEKERKDQASIYGEYDSEEMQDLIDKGNDVIEDKIAKDLNKLTVEGAKYKANKELHGEETSGVLLSYGDDKFVTGTLNRTYGDKGFVFNNDVNNDQVSVTFKGGEKYTIYTNHWDSDDDMEASKNLQKWMQGQLENEYKIGGAGNNY